MHDHPLFGDFAFDKFGVTGSAICYNGIRPIVQEDRISVKAHSSWDHFGGLVFDDCAPEGLPRRRYSFGMPIWQIERLLPWREGCEVARYFVQGPGIGQVDHVIGRSAEDFIDKGSTAQMLADCTLQISANSSGLVFEYAGSLSDEGFLRPVEPSLKMDAYAVCCTMAWQVARFYFTPNSVSLMFGKFANLGAGD